MSLFKTNLVIVAAQLPPDFSGNPQEFFEALVERMEIQSPQGTSFFVVGDSEPSSNVGPWLKNGTQWWVFDIDQGVYVPLDISASLNLLVIGPDDPGTPGVNDPVIWLRTFETRAVAWYGWTGTEWRPVSNVPPSGSTANRPTNPFDLEQYFDTDINVLIHWERGQWRTVGGSPGDIKFVAQSLLSQALTFNPGWQYVGKDDQSIRGKVFGLATQDTTAGGDSNFATDSGITPRDAGDQDGSELVVLTSTQIEQHTHLTGHLTSLATSGKLQLHRGNTSDTIDLPPVVPPNYTEISGITSTVKLGTSGNGSAGTQLITSRQLSLASWPDYTGAAEGHPNLQPTVFFWALVKV
jgi:hypothetical protein